MHYRINVIPPTPPKDLPKRSDKVQKFKNFKEKPVPQGPALSVLVR
jgi:hypothetical protein